LPRQLEAARTDDALRAVVASLWSLAVTIEDGNITDVDKALRAAQDALKQALERGASDEEIKEAHRQPACGAGQFHASARRADAQQSAAAGAAARSQYQDHAASRISTT